MPLRNDITTTLSLVLLFLVGGGCDPLGSQTQIWFEQADKARVHGQYQQAVDLYSKCLDREARVEVYGNRAYCYAKLGKIEAAIADYSQAIRMVGDITSISQGNRQRILLPYYFHRGFTRQMIGLHAEAIEDYERTIQLDEAVFGKAIGPESRRPDAFNNLAWILATSNLESCRDPKRAVHLATLECERTQWRNAASLDTFAAASAAAGAYEKAIETQKRAIELNRVTERQEDFVSRLRLYETSKPFVD